MTRLPAKGQAQTGAEVIAKQVPVRHAQNLKYGIVQQKKLALQQEQTGAQALQ